MKTSIPLIIVLIVSVSMLATPSCTTSAINSQLVKQDQQSETMTRKQAIIQYLKALYIPDEGAFYAYLKDWPTDSRIHSYHTIITVYNPIMILSYLNATSSFDISNCTAYALSLLNNGDKAIRYGPLNFSRDTPCTVIACRTGVDFFSMLGISDDLSSDQISGFVKYCQGPNGGFYDDLWDTSNEDLISTQCSLYTLDYLGRLDMIDMESAESFVLSCYSSGSFSYVPNGTIDSSSVPLGLMCLDYLNALSSINAEDVISNVLSEWDNATGCVTGGSIVDTERVIWSLYILDALDRIDTNAVVHWVLSCQSDEHGEFLPYPGASTDDERVEWCRAAVNILKMLGSLDVLNENFTVVSMPEHVIPQGYYDFISQNVLTTTTSNYGPYIQWPRIDILKIISDWGPIIIVMSILFIPAVIIIQSHRSKKRERAKLKKHRKTRC